MAEDPKPEAPPTAALSEELPPGRSSVPPMPLPPMPQVRTFESGGAVVIDVPPPVPVPASMFTEGTPATYSRAEAVPPSVVPPLTEGANIKQPGQPLTAAELETITDDDITEHVIAILNQCADLEELIAGRALTWAELKSRGLFEKLRAVLKS